MFTFHPGVALRSHAGATRKGCASSHPGCILRRMRCQAATPALIEACEGSQHARPMAAVQEPGALLSVLHAVSAASSCAGTGGRPPGGRRSWHVHGGARGRDRVMRDVEYTGVAGTT